MQRGFRKMPFRCVNHSQKPIKEQSRLSSSNPQLWSVRRHHRNRRKPFINQIPVFNISRWLGAHQTFAVASLGDQHGVMRRTLSVKDRDFTGGAETQDVTLPQIIQFVRELTNWMNG